MATSVVVGLDNLRALAKLSGMKIGFKAQGHGGRKLFIQRHGSKRGSSRHSYAAAEKALETKVRNAGRKACKEIS